jgi:antitoxin ParD1/3/4
MNVSLTPKLEKWVQSKVETGLYGSSSEVVRDALRLLYQYEEGREQKLSSLRSELLVGLKQLDAGLSERMESDFAGKIKKSGRESDTNEAICCRDC